MLLCRTRCTSEDVKMWVFKSHDKKTTTNPSTEGLETSRIYIKRPDTNKDVFRLHAQRDACKGSTDTPRGATPGMKATSETGTWFCKTRSNRER